MVFGIHRRKDASADLAARTGGMPEHDKMANGGIKTTRAKFSTSLGFNCLNPRTSEETWKADGDKQKTQANWHRHDLPPRNLHALSQANLGAASGRIDARQANARLDAPVSRQVIARHGLDQVLALSDEATGRRAALTRLADQTAALEQTLDIETGSMKMLSDELAALEPQVSHAQAQLQAHEQALGQARAELAQARQGSLGHVMAQAKVEGLEQRLPALRTHAEGLEAERNALQSTRAEVGRSMDDKMARLDGLRQRKTADTKALDHIELQLVSARAAYTTARQGAVHAALSNFFGAYTDLREHDADKARLTAMTRVLPRLADALELPARYLDGMTAQQRADAVVEQIARRHEAQVFDKIDRVLELVSDTLKDRIAASPEGTARDVANLRQAFADERAALQDGYRESRERIADSLVGQPARQLTAGRMSELPDPPSREEAAQWSEDGARLRVLAQGYRAQLERLAEGMPALKTRAEALQKRTMHELVMHLPQLQRIDSPELRDRTLNALSALSVNLLRAGAGTLAKDAQLAPMQLMHIVEMAHAVTGGDPERSARLFEHLAETPVHDVVQAHADAITAGTEPSPTDRDVASLWALASHQVPETVTSLVAANPEGNNVGPLKIDWRDVQTFWRCAQEHTTLGSGEAEQAHRGRMQQAMRGLAMEISQGERPAAGTPERRQMAIAKSAVWELQTLHGVNDMMSTIGRLGKALSGGAAGSIHKLFQQKGRGSPAENARQGFGELLQQAGTAAREWLAHPDPTGASEADQQAAAALVLALSDYLAAHRGTEKLHTQALRRLTGAEGTFNAGKEIWSNRLGAKEKQAILAAAQRHLAEAQDRHGSTSAAANGMAAATAASAAFARLTDLDGKHGALELLDEALQARASLAPGRTEGPDQAAALQALKDDVLLAQGGALDSPQAIQRLLHDAIDRTELGDRMDTVTGRQVRAAAPLVFPVGPGAFVVGVGAGGARGAIVNVQANNDCVQLTLGRTQEWSVSAALGYRGAIDVADTEYNGPDIENDKTGHGFKLSGPSGMLRYEHKSRHDPAVVIKYSIVPENGLRDLGVARGQLKEAVDVLLEWQDLRDSDGQPYDSPFEAMADRLDPPPTIDWETRDYTGDGLEATLNAGVTLEAGTDHVRAGLGLYGKAGGSRDVMISLNQQGAEEKYVTDKWTLKAEALAGVSTPDTVKKDKGGAAPNFGLTGSLGFNVGGQEVKYKFPIGTDRYRAYKLEYGLFGRDMETARDLVFATLPQVARRVQDVCKGVGLDPELTEVMEAEVVMNFARMLDEDKTDRFSTKAESSQQWSHRGLDAGIAMAAAAGDHDMAKLLAQVRDSVTEGDKDQAVKYFVAAGELAVKRSSFLVGKRAEVKSMREDPVPDTRTSTLHPTAERLQQERARTEQLAGWERQVLASSLQSARPPLPTIPEEPQADDTAAHRR